ncbi:hypothetical protein Bca4012_054722 [Brassica carinata]
MSCNADQIQDHIWKKIWKLSSPPKIQHFWWRVLHNALLVAETLQRRKIRVLSDCPFCGEYTESITHLIFQCRVSKEIWELASIDLTPGQAQSSLTITDYLNHLISIYTANSVPVFPFIGWRIWKARNDLIYNGRRWHIPDILHKAFIDHKLWSEAKNLQENNEERHHKKQSTEENTEPDYYCYTDASWVDDHSKGGVGWNKQKKVGFKLLPKILITKKEVHKSQDKCCLGFFHLSSFFLVKTSPVFISDKEKETPMTKVVECCFESEDVFIEHQKTIFVEGFRCSPPRDDIKSALIKHFRPCGKVSRVSVLFHFQTGSPMGFDVCLSSF